MYDICVRVRMCVCWKLKSNSYGIWNRKYDKINNKNYLQQLTRSFILYINF